MASARCCRVPTVFKCTLRVGGSPRGVGLAAELAIGAAGASLDDMGAFDWTAASTSTRPNCQIQRRVFPKGSSMISSADELGTLNYLIY